MQTKTKEYRGERIIVTFDSRRCIHAGECTRGAPAVFNREQRPWVKPDEGDADQIADVIKRCPTGALQFRRLDDGNEETPPAVNRVEVIPNGPLYVTGDLELQTPDGEVLLKDTRMALCRCGASQNKPFCDNGHLSAAFRDQCIISEERIRKVEGGMSKSKLEIIPLPYGSIRFRGEFNLVDSEGSISEECKQIHLCRCGASQNKPFCDGTHKNFEFLTE